MPNTAPLPSAVTNDQVFLRAIVERLDQFNEALAQAQETLAALQETIAKQATPVVNINFDAMAVANALMQAQAEQAKHDEATEVKKRAKPK